VSHVLNIYPIFAKSKKDSKLRRNEFFNHYFYYNKFHLDLSVKVNGNALVVSLCLKSLQT
jgi:hypothetical protein